MPIVHYELHEESREFNVANATSDEVIHWFVTGTMNQNDVFQTVLLATPPVHDSLVRDTISARPLGGGNWRATIVYKNLSLQHGLPIDGTPGSGTTQEPSGPGSDAEFLGPNITWTNIGSTVNIKYALRDMERKSASGSGGTNMTRAEAFTAGFMGDNKRAINSGPEGVAGVDIAETVDRWDVEWMRSSVDSAYRRTVRNLKNSVNNAEFYRYQPGELLFLGTQSRNLNGRWSITYQFAGNENRTDVEIGNGITLEEVRGWEYVSVQYEVKSVGGSLLSLPKTARVMEIYPAKNFELLEIGT